jgi:hypothetical protein
VRAEPAAEAAPASTAAVDDTPAAPVPEPPTTKVEVARGNRFRVYQAMLEAGE